MSEQSIDIDNFDDIDPEFERQFVYHGSIIAGIKRLRPRKARSGAIEDTVASVYADEDIDYAIFMALIGGRRMGGWSPNLYGGEGFFIYRDALQYLEPGFIEQITGSVYILALNRFTRDRSGHLRSFRSVPVLGEIAVGARDLAEIKYAVGPTSGNASR